MSEKTMKDDQQGISDRACEGVHIWSLCLSEGRPRAQSSRRAYRSVAVTALGVSLDVTWRKEPLIPLPGVTTNDVQRQR